MKTVTALALLLAISAAAFGQDPNRNRMNEPYPEAKPQETLGKVPAGAPPATANRMNVEYSVAPVSELAAGPHPNANRMNEEWVQLDSNAQAEKPAKPKRR